VDKIKVRRNRHLFTLLSGRSPPVFSSSPAAASNCRHDLTFHRCGLQYMPFLIEDRLKEEGGSYSKVRACAVLSVLPWSCCHGRAVGVRVQCTFMPLACSHDWKHGLVCLVHGAGRRLVRARGHRRQAGHGAKPAVI